MMKRRKILSVILTVLGIVPFVVALICGLPIFRASSLTYGDFLIFYSYLFWPTYILGVLLIAAGLLVRFWHVKPNRPQTENSSDTKESTPCSTEK